MSKKTIEKKQEIAAMSQDKAQSVCDQISKANVAIGKSYISICGKVAILKDQKGYEALGYKNIYDLTNELFGMSRGTTSNLIQIYKRFGNGKYGIDTEKAGTLGIRDMLAIIKQEKEETKLVDKEEVESAEYVENTAESGRESEIVATSTSESEDYVADDYNFELIRGVRDKKELVKAFAPLSAKLLSYAGKDVRFEVTAVVKDYRN